MWVPQPDLPAVSIAADRLGWFNVKGSQAAPGHSVLNKVAPTLAHLRGEAWPSGVLAALGLATDAGLGMGRAPSTTANLIRWAEQSSLELPERWIHRIRRYLAWAGDTPLDFIKVAKAVAAKRARVRKSGPEPSTAGNAPGEKPQMGGTGRTTISRVPVRGW